MQMDDDRKIEDVQRAETICDMLEEYHRHVDKVHSAARLLATRLIKNCVDEDEKLGMLLLKGVMEHDMSKLQGIEWPWIHQTDDKERLIAAIEHHQQVNRHHPEFWGGVAYMPPVYIAEMVCDWKARSEEKGTNLRDWIKDTALEKYSIPPTGKIARLIKKFVDLLLDAPFKSLDILKKEKGD